MNQTTSTFFEAYPSLMRAIKDPLEDLREQECEKAEERLRSQFKMERIIYSQDGLYSRQLEAVKARPESILRGTQKGWKPISTDIHEMAQHLSAYLMVGCWLPCHLLHGTFLYFPLRVLELVLNLVCLCAPQITSDRLANQVPLIVQYHMLDQYIVNVKTATSGMLRHKDATSFVQEKDNIAFRRKYLLERMERLKKARQVLSKSVPAI